VRRENASRFRAVSLIARRCPEHILHRATPGAVDQPARPGAHRTAKVQRGIVIQPICRSVVRLMCVSAGKIEAAHENAKEFSRKTRKDDNAMLRAASLTSRGTETSLSTSSIRVKAWACSTSQRAASGAHRRQSSRRCLCAVPPARPDGCTALPSPPACMPPIWLAGRSINPAPPVSHIIVIEPSRLSCTSLGELLRGAASALFRR